MEPQLEPGLEQPLTKVTLDPDNSPTANLGDQ